MLQNLFQGEKAKSFGLIPGFSSFSGGFFLLFSLFAHEGESKNWHLNTRILHWVDFPSFSSVPGPVEGVFRCVRFFASNAWLMAASWSFLKPSVQPQNWPPSKPARKMTVPVSGFSLNGQRYVWSSAGVNKRDVSKDEKKAP